jgi:hypothetical protein
MGEDRSSGEGKLECAESALAAGVKTPRCVLLEKVGHWDDNIRVPWDKATVEIPKTEEGLDIMDIAGLWPVQDYFLSMRIPDMEQWKPKNSTESCPHSHFSGFTNRPCFCK